MITRFARSVRGRLTLLATATMAVLCLAVSAYVMYAAYQFASHFQQNVLEGIAMRTVQLVHRGRLPPTLPPGFRVSVQVVAADGRVIAATPDISGARRMSALEPPSDVVTTRPRRHAHDRRFRPRCPLCPTIAPAE